MGCGWSCSIAHVSVGSPPVDTAGAILQRAKTGMTYRRYHGRLAQFRQLASHAEFWEKRWGQRDIGSLLRAYSSGKLDEFEDVFTRYLPRDLPILEAGCGLGQLVMALDARGYDAEGVDYARRTVEAVRAAAPGLRVRVGDVYRLDVASGTYGGYIPIGVFEHDPEGPLRALLEMKRVLHPRGVAFVAVPYLNSVRRRWAKRLPPLEAAPLPDGYGFYQFYFGIREFEEILVSAGLQAVEVYPYAVYSGLTRDLSAGRWLHEQEFLVWRLHRRVTRWCREAPSWLRRRHAHMVMFVCRHAG